MKTKTKQGHIHFSSEWEHIESEQVGLFTTKIVHRRPDGEVDVRTSRRHRKQFGPEASTQEKGRPKLLLWRPRSLNWWIAVLLMIGAAHFIIGSLLLITGSTNHFLIDFIYFSGSLFFTVAIYSVYYQAINAPEALDNSGQAVENQSRRYFAWQPERIDFWVTFPQFLGALAFNFMTFMAFFSLQWMAYDILGWIPNIIGCTLFLISGIFAILELCYRFVCWQWRNLAWWSGHFFKSKGIL